MLRSASQTSPFSSIATVGAGATSFVHADAPIGDNYYVVRASDLAGNVSANSNTVFASVPQPPVGPLSNNATSETPIAGTVNGTFADTTARGGAAQTITEVDSGGKPRDRYDLAEHRWTIPASTGNQSLTVVASAPTGGDADTGFAVEWSTDGSTWVPFATVGNGETLDVTTSIGAPTGDVHVRVIDTDRSRGNTSHNSISVDFLGITGGGEAVQPTDVVASLSTSYQSAGGGQQYGVVTVQVNDNLGNPVSGAVVKVNLLGSFSGSLTGTTGDSGIASMRTASSARKPSFTACVSSITGPALRYTPGTEACPPPPAGA